MEDGTAASALDAAGLRGELGDAVAELRGGGTLTEQSLRRIEVLIGRFGEFATSGLGRSSLAEVSPDDARLFVEASGASGEPSVATMHLRRCAVRMLFGAARRIGVVDGDPTLDLVLPAKSSLRSRPLSDDEVALCRSAALYSLTSTRLAAAWALAEASARTAELPRLTVADVDLEGRRVWVHGSRRTEARWGVLSEWGGLQLARHLDSRSDWSAEDPLIYRGRGSEASKQASSCVAIGEVLTRAGLGGEADVRPVSVAAWAGRRVFAESGRIDEVTRRLGMRSLDRAAQLIDLDWAVE